MTKLPEQLIETEYGDHEISEYNNTPVPTWLKILYAILPVWGVVFGMYFMDGSQGWFDRGHWHDLQEAAQTTQSSRTAPAASVVKEPTAD